MRGSDADTLTVSPEPDDPTFASARARFLEALEASSRGAPRPSPDDFLAETPEPDRGRLREELRAIQDTFLDRLAVNSPGVTTAPGTAPPGGPDETVDRSPLPATETVDLSDDRGRATESFVPSGKSDAGPPPRPRPSASIRGRGPDPSRYEVLGELGRGGMGVVYKARQIGLNRVVALKMILAGGHASEGELDRFRDEGLAVAALKHPNIVQIFDVGESEGLPYFALEFVEGPNLAKHLDGKPIPPRRAAELTRTLAVAIAAAHAEKIIHRDLKPANILLTAAGEPKVTDFGLAKRLENASRQTHTGAIMGTPSYMSPEQAWGQTDRIGTPADVYALGAILYDCLTGRPPFQGVTTLETLDLVRQREPVSPSQFQPGVSRDLETICLKCLAKDQAHRYASATDLADDLGRFLRNEPIRARPVSQAERAWRWAKRNPWVAGLGSAVGLLLVAVATGSSYFAVRLADESSKARDAAKRSDVARGKEAVAREEADRNAGQAREALGLTTDALRGFLFKVQDVLRTRPDLSELRETIIQSTMGDLEKVRVFALANPVLGRTEAATLSLLGSIYLQLGRVGKAAGLYERAHATLAEEFRRDPNDPVNLRNMANAENALADVSLRLGDGGKALGLYASAVGRRKAWAAADPANPGARQAVAETLALLGYAELLLGDPRSARGHYAESLERFRDLPEDVRNDPNVRRSVASAEDQFGVARLRLGDIDGAKAQHRRAQEQRLALFNDTGNRYVRRDIAHSQLSFGDLYQTAAKDPALAWVEYGKARRNIDVLLKDDPNWVDVRRDLGLTLYRLGDTADRLKAAEAPAPSPPPEPAARYFDECLKVRRDLAATDPKDTQARIDLMIALARLGRSAEAEAIVDDLRGQAGDDPRILFQSACALSLGAAHGEGEAAGRSRDRAVAAVADLVRSGWKDRFSLETDPDLEAARADPRFAPVIAGLPALPSPP